MLEGSATHDVLKRSDKGTTLHTIYMKTKSDTNAFLDQSVVKDKSKTYEMLKNGYALIRPFDEVHSLMKVYNCTIVFPAKGLKYDKLIYAI